MIWNWFKRRYTNDMGNGTNSANDTNTENEPAEWRPYNHEEFSKDTQEIAEIYKSDPSRISGSEDTGDVDEPAND